MPRPRSELAARRAPGTAGGPTSTRLYTRTGDRGETGLFGGTRVAKDSPRIRAFGALDELGAQLGLARSSLPFGSEFALLQDQLVRLQNEVYIAQAELASPNEPARYRIEARHVQRLEKEIDASSEALTPQNSFVLSHGIGGGAQLHVARTVARRAERVLWALNRVEPLRPELLTWMNRLGDLLFALALEVNRRQQVPERSPDYSV